MKKKMQQLISFTMALLLIVSSVDMPVLAVESSSIETAEEQSTDELEENAEISKQEEDDAEISSLEMTETQNEKISTEDTAFINTDETITSNIESDTAIETKADNITKEESLTEINLQEDAEKENTENKEILAQTEQEDTQDTTEEIKIELVPKLEMEIGQVENILSSIYPKGIIEEDIIWTVSNPHILAVNNGQAIAIDIGEATITASIKGTNEKAECHISVKDADFDVQSFSFYSAPRNITYNGYGAAAYAKTHNDEDIREGYGPSDCSKGNTKGVRDTADWLCADLVAHSAIEGGGLPSAYFSRSCTQLRKNLNNSGYCTEYTTKVRSDGYIYKQDFSGTIAIGDIILYYCPSEKNNPHAVMFAGWSNNGRLKAYAHNSRNNGNEQQYPKCGYCGVKVNTAYVMHFKGNTASDEAVPPSISFGQNSVAMNTGETATLPFSFAGSNLSGIECDIEDRSIADLAHWEWDTNNNGFMNIQGYKEGTTNLTLRIMGNDNTATLLSKSIPITVTELSVNYNQDSVETNLNETKTFEFSFTGSNLSGLECNIEDRSIADLTDWRWDENNHGTISIKGYKEGTTNLTLHIMGNDNTATLFSKSIPITVMKPSVSFGQNSVEVGINKTKEITFSFRGANLQEINLDIADQSIATLEHWSWDADNNGIIRIKGHKKGTTTMTLYLVGADGSRISSKTIPITVKDSLSGITLNASTKELTVGSSFQLSVSYIPSTATPEGTVKWTSSNTSVAIVDTRGRVKALKREQP